LLQGVSWIALILLPWAFMGLLADFVQVIHLSFGGHVLVYALFIAAIPQLFLRSNRSGNL
jgi:hypothetical protein